jgi:hypothetical protein
MNECHVLGQRNLDVADIRRPPVSSLDVADEVAEVARDVDDARARLDVPLQELAKLLPDRFLGSLVSFVEALLVDLLENDRRYLIGAAVRFSWLLAEWFDPSTIANGFPIAASLSGRRGSPQTS